ncbi:hypothetical protein [Candidatus Raskinella chloraquaticus]|uniref:Uncharacterized protein n=1 Tax=Candidatus Raskinella chloraquaticus TaxID=1951219 RepID=A0A1W9I0T9_9HYPH|nr:MAG: hypothetical protein A4S15_05185 [Proteobacteria bacterium SG_bin8]
MAVRKALRAGRITVEGDGTINAQKADRAWGLSSNPAQVRPVAKSPPTTRGTPRPVPMAAVEAVRETLRESTNPRPSEVGCSRLPNSTTIRSATADLIAAT